MKKFILEDASDDIQNLIKKVSNYEEFVAKLGELASDPKVQAFLTSGRADGDDTDDKFTATEKAIPVKKLRPTQNEIDRDGSLKWPLTDVKSLNNCLKKGPVTIKAPVVTYNGQYIIDGHHRWSQLYSINKDGQINCIDLTGPKLKPIDVLKAVQLAIAADTGKITSATVEEGNNLLDMDGNSVAKYVTSTITDECIRVFNKMRSGVLGKLDKNNIAGKIVVPNVMEMQKTSQPAPGAPKRNVMPQTDDATNAINLLNKGVINYNEPYTTEHYQRKIYQTLNTDKMKMNRIKYIIREEIKSELKQIIKEEYTSLTKQPINESIVDSIIKLVLGGVIAKKAQELRDDPEYKELDKRIKEFQKEMELHGKRIKRVSLDKNRFVKPYKMKYY